MKITKQITAFVIFDANARGKVLRVAGAVSCDPQAWLSSLLCSSAHNLNARRQEDWLPNYGLISFYPIFVLG